MERIIKRIGILVLSAFVLFSATNLNAGIKKGSKDKDDSETIQRKYSGVYDVQQNTVSNIQFYTSNYGIFGMDVARGVGGGYWPRGSMNQYIFGGGVWFGALKQQLGTNPDSVPKKKYCEVSYNPNSGKSWMVPGRFEDGKVAVSSDYLNYRTYFSGDFSSDGSPITKKDGPNWPIWDASTNIADTLKNNRYFGYYILNKEERNNTKYTKGPAFISAEDIFCVFKDTDLNAYEGGFAQRKTEGYPLGIQYEHTIYSWGFGEYRDFIFLRYDMTNSSADTLWDCWLAPVMDVDIARAPNTSAGAPNDRANFYDTDPTLNLAYQWSNSNLGEKSYGFGYLGFDFLESPAVTHIYDAEGKEIPVYGKTGFVRKDKQFYSNDEQLGLTTFRNWSIDQDPTTDDGRYNWMAKGTRDGDTGPGDKRFMMATGPFHMLPNDTVRTIVGIILANACKASDPTGLEEDLCELVRRDKFAQGVYDNNFRAPVPPDRSVVTKWQPLNNGVTIEWDSTSEMSSDKYEKGLDFMGYKVYRARRVDLDTFDLDVILGASNPKYPGGKGPLGWKQIAQYELPVPFIKSVFRGGTDQNNTAMPFIDSLVIVGPVQDDKLESISDSMAIKVMRLCKSCTVFDMPRTTWRILNGDSIRLRSMQVFPSRFARPWSDYFRSMVDNDPNFVKDTPDELQLFFPQFPINAVHKNYDIYEKTLVGTVYLNKALYKFNPLLFKKDTRLVNTLYIDTVIRRHFTDGMVGKYIVVEGDSVWKRTTLDSVYDLATQIRFPNGSSSIEVYLPRRMNTIIKDENHLTNILAFIYKGIQNQTIKIEFPEFEDTNPVKMGPMASYMREITGNRFLTDIGDDNKNGIMDENEQPGKNEKLLNNIDYFYKVLAYDEGDYQQPTSGKINAAFTSLSNFVNVMPHAARSEKSPKFTVEVTPENQKLIGGLYNFNFYAIDPERTVQYFDNHDLELEFQPSWNEYSILLKKLDATVTDPTPFFTKFGLYQRRATLTDLTVHKVLFEGLINFEVQPCQVNFNGSFTENAASYVLRDTSYFDSVANKYLTFGTRNNRDIKTRSGHFTSGDFKQEGFCYTPLMNPPAYGTIGFDFDFTMQQFGGRYRPDSTTLAIAKTEYDCKAETTIGFLDEPNGLPDQKYIQTTTMGGLDPGSYQNVPGSFNNGPGDYVVEFMPGGKETIEIVWNGTTLATQIKNTFNVDYLTLKVTNRINYNRPNETGGDSILVNYPNDYSHMYIPTPVIKNTVERAYDANLPPGALPRFDSRWHPDPRNLYYGFEDPLNPRTNEFIGKFNLAAYPWVNARYNQSVLVLRNQIGRAPELKEELIAYSGKQGKYYLSAVSVDGKDTIDFTHIVNIGGVQFAFDYANKGRHNVTNPQWAVQKNYTFGPDFKVGDKVVFKTFGGALGMPMPGAKVKIKIGSATNAGVSASTLLDQVKVVPNPYYVTHQGQKSPYDTKLFFTKLPAKCTIKIYTISGDLVKELNHVETANPSIEDLKNESIEIWDLMSANKMKVQSQSFIAVITTPEGVQAEKVFSVVVGSSRVFQE